jgi:hypothetical protein
MDRECICMGKKWKAYRIWVVKTKGKRPLGKPGCRWEENIRVIQWGGMDWTDLTQNRDQLKEPVTVVMNLRIP